MGKFSILGKNAKMMQSNPTHAVYAPQEDSHFLADAVRKHAFGSVLDVGTGSGIQAATAAEKKEVTSVVAVDISEEALRLAVAANRNTKGKIRFLKSDLFSSINGKFDTIIFNPPYLPQDDGVVDAAIYGGRRGHEVLERFLNECNSHLNDSGIILIAFSSLTNKAKVDEIIEGNCLEHEELAQKHIFFETLYVYIVRKSRLLLQLQQQGITDIKLFEKGNRGVLYKGSYKGRAVVVKAKRKESKAVATIENEINWLKTLNAKGMGPKLVVTVDEWFAYNFVGGKFILDFISSCNEKSRIRKAIANMLLQCRELDKLKVNKEEMSRPHKHALVDDSGKITMLDFERCRRTMKPKNVTQLCQFITGARANHLLRQKGITIEREKVLAAAKEYKNNQNAESFKKVKGAALGTD